jgi:hypothetical protein
MKAKVLLICVFLVKRSVPKTILSGKVSYLAELIYDENNIKENLKKMKGSKEIKNKMIKELYKSSSKLNFELKFNKQESIFKKLIN